MKTILVPTDFSLVAESALKYAVAIAQKEDAKIMVMNAFNIESMYTLVAYPAFVIEQEMSRAEELADIRLKKVCRWLRDDQHVQCDHISVLGRPVESIRKTIKTVKPDLVVMGTKGVDTLSDRMFGSTAANIIGRSGCHVLAVPANGSFNHIQRIAFAVDPDQNESVIIKNLAWLRALFSGHITIIWVLVDVLQKDVHKKKLKQLKQKADNKFGADALSYRLVTDEFVQDELLKLAKNRHYDLLAMVTRQRSLLQLLIGQSATWKVAKNLKVPLLALKAGK